MAILMEKVIFSDLCSHPDTTPLTVNVDSVKYSIYNLLTTEKGQRLNLVAYGVDLSDNLFDQMDDITSWELITNIVHAIKIWEPRVGVNTSMSRATPYYDDHYYDLLLYCYIIGFPGLDFSISGKYRKLIEKY